MTDQQGWGPPQQHPSGQIQQPYGGPQQYSGQPQQPGTSYQQPPSGYGYPPPPQQGYPAGSGHQAPRPKKGHRVRNVLLGIVSGLVLIIIIASVASSGNGVQKTGSPPAANTATSAPSSPAATTPSPAAPAARQYTPEQQQAIDAAEQYLQMGSGFSRLGLIQQLDSPDGNGFTRAAARFAVNHINVNWDQQAAEAAKGYMQQGGFSFSSMVQQLESPDGNDFTYSQAVYGAKAVGL
jgi:Host cell surface-exposed lipoprotein